MKILAAVLFVLFLLVLYTLAKASPPDLLIGTDYGRYHQLSKTTKGEPADLYMLSIEAPKKRYFGIHPGIHVGTWNRNDPANSAKFVGIDSILNAPMVDNWFMKFTLGVSRLLHNTDRLGTKSQFHLAWSVGQKLHRADVSCGFQHWSNGKFFHRFSNRPNHAEDFLSCGWRTAF